MVIAIILIVLDFVMAGFGSIYFGISCFIAALVAYAGFGFLYQLFAFSASLVILLLTFHKVVKVIFLRSGGGETNIHALIGRRGVVVEEINNLEFRGRVKIGGEYWKAQSQDEEIIEKGSPIVVVGVEGSKVIVKKEVI